MLLSYDDFISTIRSGLLPILQGDNVYTDIREIIKKLKNKPNPKLTTYFGTDMTDGLNSLHELFIYQAHNINFEKNNINAHIQNVINMLAPKFPEMAFMIKDNWKKVPNGDLYPANVVNIVDMPTEHVAYFRIVNCPFEIEVLVQILKLTKIIVDEYINDESSIVLKVSDYTTFSRLKKMNTLQLGNHKVCLIFYSFFLKKIQVDIVEEARKVYYNITPQIPTEDIKLLLFNIYSIAIKSSLLGKNNNTIVEIDESIIPPTQIHLLDQTVCL